MILNKGLWFLITIDGIDGAISQTINEKASNYYWPRTNS